MKKKLLSLILAGLMLAGSMLSCSDSESGKKTETQPTQGGSQAAEETAITYLDEIPDTAKFDGQEIRYVAARDVSSIYVDLEDEEGQITDIVAEAVWRRNNIVQERLDVEIKFIEEIHRDSFNKTVMNSINASSDDYDVFVGHQRFQVELASQGVMKNLANLENLDLTKPYWAGDYIENLSYKGISYWITGDMQNSFIGDAWVMFVNSTLWNMTNSDKDIYSLVREGKWTLDTLNEVVANTYVDNNGNGKVDGEDRFGFFLEPSIRGTAMMLSSEVFYSDKDAEGVPYLIIQDEHTYNAFEKIHGMMYNNQGVLNKEPDEIEDNDMFVQDNLMILIDNIATLSSDEFRDMESDYKVIPLPKYDEQQENYVTTHYDGVAVIGIPITVPEEHIDAITATLEVTSSVAHEISLPAYYDGAMKNKYSRDPEQAEMVDLIHDTITGDFAHIYGDVVGKYCSLYSFWSANLMRESISSMLQKNAKLWEKDLETLLEAFEEHIDN